MPSVRSANYVGTVSVTGATMKNNTNNVADSLRKEAA